MNQALLTIQELAKKINANPGSIRGWINQGLIPTVRLGRAIRIRPDIVEQILRSGIPSASRGNDAR